MLTRWNNPGFGDIERSFSALDELRREVERLFWDYERGVGLDRGQRTDRSASAGFPRVSLHDTGPELYLRAEVPGMSEKDLDVSIEQSSLSIRGERRVEVPEGYSVHRNERPSVSFSRSFTLPCRVNAEKVIARLKHGVLELTLPKAEEERPRRIQVRTS